MSGIGRGSWAPLSPDQSERRHPGLAERPGGGLGV